ncbi:MAG: type I DNA topoisomerase [Acidobacteria bacterium]|nr:type I DNA topoisomerase [Acidobacteriota bacterium]
MSKPLVIVESPSKAKTISKYLKGHYNVKASVGHIRDLPKSKIGVDTDNSFNPTYEILRGKEKIVDELLKAAESAESIYLAADPDREGEAICWHLEQLLAPLDKKVNRIIMNQITKSAVEDAFANPHVIDMNKVNAQQARRIIDRLVGYKISPLLWEKVRRGLSAGRVQSIAVKMICEREKEIQAFVPEEYWNIIVTLSAENPPNFTAKLIKENGKKLEVNNGEQAGQIVKILDKASYKVSAITKKSKKKNPYPPFITSKLQQAAANKLGFTVRRTMIIAQKLYEGIDVGESGPVGLITYMRTDSVRVANDAINEVRDYIKGEYPAEYLPDTPNIYKSRKQAQDAHEAIRPTSVMRTPDSLKQYLNADEMKIYRLIWEQFVASQMTPALYDTTTVDIDADRFTLRASGSIMKFDGYQKILKPQVKKNGDEDESGDEDDSDKLLPPLKEDESLKREKIDSTQHFTQPPPRYNEASLVKELEANGIGRPSTYAVIVSTIQDRQYVVKEERRFKPTELGMLVNELLEGSFGDMMQTAFTANLEENLDSVEEGKKEWVELLSEFNKVFEKDLEVAKKEMRNVKTEETPTDEICDKCGANMVIKWGRFGKFLACSGYPECRNTREIAQDNGDKTEVEEEEKHECPNCGKDMVLKKGRWGVFLACSGYPECKTTQSVDPGTLRKKNQEDIKEKCPKCGSQLVWKYGKFGEFIACSSYPKCDYIKQNTIGMKCPNDGCDGEIVEKKSRRNTTFYGCTKYPGCDFASPNKPIAKSCPKCGKNFILEKVLKRKGTVHYCIDKECGWEEVVKPPEE